MKRLIHATASHLCHLLLDFRLVDNLWGAAEHEGRHKRSLESRVLYVASVFVAGLQVLTLAATLWLIGMVALPEEVNWTRAIVAATVTMPFRVSLYKAFKI